MNCIHGWQDVNCLANGMCNMLCVCTCVLCMAYCIVSIRLHSASCSAHQSEALPVRKTQGEHRARYSHKANFDDLIKPAEEKLLCKVKKTIIAMSAGSYPRH